MRLLVNIEGNDGTGKRTSAIKLKELWTTKYYMLGGTIDCQVIDFPAYNSPTGHIVSEFLNGNILGNPSEAGAYAASIPYTLDRLAYYQAHEKELNSVFKEDDDKLHIIICNRSYLSNYFYQASKLMHSHEIIRAWLAIQHRLEIVGSPIGNFDPVTEIVNYYLAPMTLVDNIEKMKARREKLDLHEQNAAYLQKVEDFALGDGARILDNIIQESRDTFQTSWATYYDYDIAIVPYGKTEEAVSKISEHVAMTISATMIEKIEALCGKVVEIRDGD